MEKILSCYYLDEPLTDEELQFLSQTLLGPWARFKTGATVLQQKRVPAILPLPDENGHYAQSREQRAFHIRNNLRHAGIHADCGRQVVWVTPRDADWDAIFQFAIHNETGVAPFVAQRWYVENDVVTRGTIRLVNTELLWRGLK
jgi:hypothetical protein